MLQVESTYKDILLRKGIKMRIFETILFVIGMLLLSSFFDTRSDLFKLLAVAIAVIVVGLAPFF